MKLLLFRCIFFVITKVIKVKKVKGVCVKTSSRRHDLILYAPMVQRPTSNAYVNMSTEYVRVVDFFFDELVWKNKG